MRLKTRIVAATAKTPSLKASARVFLTATTISRRSDFLGSTPESPGLLAVAAGGHAAPAARVVLGAVVERVATGLRAAQLHARPAFIVHRRVQCGDDATHRTD